MTAVAASRQTRDGGLYSFIPDNLRTLREAFLWLEALQRGTELAEALGAFLRSTRRPDHFVTLTLRDRHVRGHGDCLAGMVTLERAWESFCHQVRNALGHRFEWLRVVEYQQRGVPHVHALTFRTARLKSFERFIEERLWTDYGMSRIDQFRIGGNAAEYCGSYLNKDRRVQLACSRNLHRLLSRPITTDGEAGVVPSPGTSSAPGRRTKAEWSVPQLSECP